MSLSIASHTGYNISIPNSAPGLAVGTTSGELIASALYGYAVSNSTPYGETPAGPSATITTDSNGSVILTLPVEPNNQVNGRKIYRTTANGSTYYLLDAIHDNYTTDYIDIKSDDQLVVEPPNINSANSIQIFDGWCMFTKPITHSIEKNITAGVGGTSAAAYQLNADYNWISTVASANDSVKMPGLLPLFVGVRIKIRNNGANVLRVYPFDGQSINGLSADTPITLSVGASTELVSDGSTDWSQI